MWANNKNHKSVERFHKDFAQANLVKNKTSKTEVIALYGTTRDRTLYQDKTEIWNYYANSLGSATTKSKGLNENKLKAQQGTSIAIYFNAKGIMKGYAISD